MEGVDQRISITVVLLSIQYQRGAKANDGCCNNDDKLCKDLCALH